VRKAAPSEDELLAMVEHVAFDMGQQRALYDVVLKVRVAQTAAENAALYAFLLHSRNLLGFYWPPPRERQQDGDVFAMDYVRGLELAKPRLDHSVAELKKAISTRVAHICLLRISKVGWASPVIMEVLFDASSEFLAQVQEPYRSEFVRCKIVHDTW
jgi:hypothetical protein